MTADSPLKTQLEEACQDLWWSSEADYPVEVVWQSASEVSSDEQKPTHEKLVRRVMNISAADKLIEVEVEAFCERSLTPKSWHTAEDKAQLAQLQRLKNLLTDSLQKLKVYRHGEVDISLYILGYTAKGDLACVKTCLVET